MIKILYTSFIVVLFGCSIGPDYQSPDLGLPQQYNPESSPRIANINTTENKSTLWWKSFNDPKLEQLINISAVDNLKIQEALTRIDQAEALRRDAFFAFFPQPNLQGQFIKNKTASARFPGIANNGIQYEIYSANVSANWEIDVFGRLRRAYEAAEYREAESIYNTVTTINSIHAQIATTYFQYLGALKQKQIALQNASNQQKTLDIIQKKFDVGMTSAFDLEITKAQTVKTRSLVEAYEYLASSALNRLSALIGRYPKDLPDVIQNESIPVTIPNYIGPISLGNPLQLLQRRPDVRAVEEQAKAASAEVGVAMGDLYPRINFLGTLSREARDIGDITTSAASAYNYGPSISWSILNINAILNRIDASKYNAKATLLNYQNTVVLAIEEVDNALKNVNQLLSKSELLKISAESARKAQEIAKAKYDIGSINLLDLLIAQNQTLSNESEYVSSLVDLDVAYVNLFKSLGGAWDDTNKSEST